MHVKNKEGPEDILDLRLLEWDSNKHVKHKESFGDIVDCGLPVQGIVFVVVFFYFQQNKLD